MKNNGNSLRRHLQTKPLNNLRWFVLAVGVLSFTGQLGGSSLETKSLHDNAVQRFVVIYSYVAELHEASVIDKLEESTQHWKRKLSPRVLQELQIALLQRLTLSNPREALEFALDTEEESQDLFIKAVIDPWATTDLDEAISRAKHSDWRVRYLALESIVQAQLDLPLAKLCDVAQELGLDKARAVEIFIENINVELIDDPKTAWYQLAEFSKDYNIRYDAHGLLGRLAMSWFREDGFTALDEIRGVRWQDYEKGHSIETVIKIVAQESPLVAFDYVLNLPERDYTLEEAVIRIWVKKDRDAAIKAVAGVREHDLRENFQLVIAGEWGSEEPHYILRNLHVLPEHSRFVAVRTSIGEIAKSSLQEAGKFALQIEDLELRSIAVSGLLRIWSKQEPSTLVEWLVNDPATATVIEDVREQLVYTVLDLDPVRAFQLAREHPITDWEPGWGGKVRQSLLKIPFATSGIGLEAQIMDDIARRDIKTALELLPDVRDGDTKTVATMQVGYALRYLGKVQEALELAQILPASNRKQYYSGIINEWIEGDPNGLVQAISKFDTTELQSRAAMRLLWWNRRHDELSDTQIETLQQYLIESDRLSLEYY